MKKKLLLGLAGLAVLGLGTTFNVKNVSAEEISSDVVLDGDVDAEYKILDGGSLTILTEGEIGEITVESGGSLVVESPVCIENLYINPGASVTLNSCVVFNITIEYGNDFNAQNISFGEEVEIFSESVKLLIPAGSESSDIMIPSVSNIFYEDSDRVYYFGAWTEDDKCLGSFIGEDFTPATSYSYNSSNEDVILTAGGADITYNALAFITSVNNKAFGTVSESVMYSTKNGEFNKDVIVNFAPNEGYEVACVKLNGEEILATSPYTFSPTKLYGKETFHVEYAEATKMEYAITTNAGEGGIITNSLTVEEGSGVEIEITANEGYEIYSLVINGSSVQGVTGLTNYTYSNDAVSENLNIVASFKIKQFTISMNAGIGGSISGSGTVNYGDDAIISITPSEGYKIKTLYIDGVSVDVKSELSIENVTANHSVQVEFEKLKYTITTNEVDNGVISSPTYAEHGESVEISIIPNSGYLIESVKVNGDDYDFSPDVNGSTIITLTNIKCSQAVSISFIPAFFSINVKTDLGVTASYTKNVNYGSNMDVLINISKGYKVTGIIKNGENISSDTVSEIINNGKIEVVNICSNVKFIIHAEKIVYTISYVLNGGINTNNNPETFTISNLGESLSAPSKVGYLFKGWKIGDKVVTTFTLTDESLDNLVLTAEWEEVKMQGGLSAGKTIGILAGGTILSGGATLGAILALKKKKWFD